MHITARRGLPVAGGGAPATGGLPSVVRDRRFAQQNGLPSTGIVRVAGAVAIAPLFTLRRLWRMDIPFTLRVVE